MIWFNNNKKRLLTLKYAFPQCGKNTFPKICSHFENILTFFFFGGGGNYIVWEAQILEIYVATVMCTPQVRRSAVGLWPRPAQAVCE